MSKREPETLSELKAEILRQLEKSETVKITLTEGDSGHELLEAIEAGMQVREAAGPASSGPLRRGELFGLAGPYFLPPFRYSIGSIWGSGAGAEKVLDIRGWGHLTGAGAHNLPAEQAEKIQDEIGEHIARLLNGSWPNS